MENIEEFKEQADRIEQELEKINDNVKTLREQNAELIESIKNERSINITIKKLLELREKNEDKPNSRAYIARMIVCLSNSVSLDILYESLEKTDKSKLLRLYKNEYANELRKMNKKLTKSKYHFPDAKLLEVVLSKHMSEDDAKLFIFSLARFINSHGSNFIRGASLFVSQLLKNILFTATDDFPEKEEFLNNIKLYIETIKG